MAWTGGWRKPAIGAGVLALHALAIAVLIRAGISTPLAPPEQETVLSLTPIPPPPKPAEKKPHAPNPAQKPRAITTTLPYPITLPPVSNPPSTALQGLGATLGCGASNYGTLSDAQRAGCERGPWQFDHQTHETASLMIPPGPHQLTPAEIAEHTRRTEDPCLAEKAAHLDFCIYRVIYGDKLP